MVGLEQEDWDALYQAHKEMFVRLDLYEYVPDPNEVFVFRKVDEISGVCIKGTVNVDAESDVRRTANLDFHVVDSTFVVTSEERIWVNKHIKIYMGYKSLISGNILWYDLGFFEMEGTSYTYDARTQTLSLYLADMTISLDGTKNGDIYGAPVKLEAGSYSIQRAMRDILHQRGNWYKDWIEPIGPYGKEEVVTQNRIPYTIEMALGSTVYEVIKKLRDLYPGYESFFDLDGTFRCRRLPTCMEDPVAITHEQLMPLVISESPNSLDLAAVRNVSEVWGKDYEEGGYFSDKCFGSGGNYEVEFKSYQDTILPVDDDHVFSFVPNHSNTGSCTLSINGLEPKPIVMYIPGAQDEREIPAGFIEQGKVVRLKYQRGADGEQRFTYIGRSRIHVVHMLVSRERTWKEKVFDIQRFNCHNISYSVNPESPLTVDKIGERYQVLCDGEFDNITNESDAMDRAQYETWKATNLAFTLTLETMIIPWLDVNEKISYYSPLFQMFERENGIEPNYNTAPQYIIKKINRTLNGTQTMELTRFYNLYPFIISDNHVHIH